MITLPADLLLTNARVLTLEPGQPVAEAVAARGETIVAVGGNAQVASLRGPETRVVDCREHVLLPGFNDAHCHLLALAASLTGVDCGSDKAASIEGLKQAIRVRAERTLPGSWIRGFGYDDLALAERRHPTRWDLDQAAPHHPVRLDHRSGHATVLNSLGLELAAIHRETPDPEEGVIERDESSGEPTGLLLELAGFLRRRLGRVRGQHELDEGVASLDEMLLQYGITSVQDAGPGNDLARWEAFRGLKESGRLTCRVTMMAGVNCLEEFKAVGLSWGSGDDWLRLGHAKAMVTLTTGAMHPDLAELEELVMQAHRAGFPVAVHAVEQEAVSAVARTLQEEKGGGKAGDGLPHLTRSKDRIEHCSECPPKLLKQVKSCGAMVVTQPGFIYWNGDRYLERVEPGLWPYLYPAGALAAARIPVAFGSDAPVIDPNPWPAIYSAVTGNTRTGRSLSEDKKQGYRQKLSVMAALERYTRGGTCAEGSSHHKGTIKAGKLADLALLDADPTKVELSRLKDIKAVLTVLGGRVVWERGF
jgi:predicted amidohydrolase YtcJ